MTEDIQSAFVEVDGLRLHYTEAGAGEPVLLLHGWPTSSLLWRNVMPQVAAHNRVIALDLPGFGASDKPLGASYSFRFFDRVLSAFLDRIGVRELGLAVHDLGGPLGLYWATRQPERVRRLALLNTLVYPELSWAAMAFVTACRLPGLRGLLTTSWGLGKAMKVGMAQHSRITPELLEGVRSPFRERDAKRALAKAGCGLHPNGLRDLARLLPQLTCPTRMIYGEHDKILPDVARTMARVKKDLPHAEIYPLANCGHFLQEDDPAEVGRLMAEHFGTQ